MENDGHRGKLRRRGEHGYLRAQIVVGSEFRFNRKSDSLRRLLRRQANGFGGV